MEGNIPLEIQGKFYRNGPGLLDVYGTPLVHPIDGDGMVCSVSMEHGKAVFKSKFVKTDEYKAEKTMKKSLYRGMMGTNPPDDWADTLQEYLHVSEPPSNAKFKNPSNTNVYYWGGKLLSCWESGLPYCLDPVTLDTIGKDTLGGVLDKANCLAAHFRIDSKQDLLVTFSLRLSLRGAPSLYIHEFDRAWNLVRQQVVKIEQYYYAHDFLLTENYYIFHHTPFYNLSMENVMKIASMESGPGESMHYYPEIPSGMVVLARYPKGEPEMQFFPCQPFHIYHHSKLFL